ncbi:MAG: STAS domain-containing protein [Candidatus Gracilibacteria bacterium]|jgi:anti-anti-sigma factor|nr:STAS domain-containing protein [Candidatus Gracilibacteria bacterium]
MANFQIRLLPVSEKPNVRVIHVGGEIDELCLDEFKKEVGIYLKNQNIDTFILFLRDLEFINSMVVGYLAEVFSNLNQENRKLILAEGNDQILDILELVGFLNLAEYHNTIQEAIDSLDF